MEFYGPNLQSMGGTFLTNNLINEPSPGQIPALLLHGPKDQGLLLLSTWNQCDYRCYLHPYKFYLFQNKWLELFPTIVLEEITIRVLFNGSSSDNPDGSLQLIYTELQATTPFISKRRFAFLTTCKQIDQSTWVVAGVPIEASGNVGYPSGCQGTAEGLSKVIWVEHFKIKQRSVERKFYNLLGHIGFAFGAERWAACLERSCESKSYEIQIDTSAPGLSEGDLYDYENTYMMELGQRMVDAFCQIISPFSPTIDDLGWSFVSGPPSLKIYATVRESPFYDDPKEMVIVAATTLRLRQSPEFVFEILADERRRHEWDLSGRPKGLTKVGHYISGNDTRNRISLYEIDKSSGHHILQETSFNRSGSLVVWSMVKHRKYDGGLPMCLPLNTLKGFSISSNSLQNNINSSSNTDGAGSLVTLGVQLRAISIKPLEELDPKEMPMDSINKYIKETVRRLVRLLKKVYMRTQLA
uniref:homeobox-leucine zipper protein HDG11-like n=1 Tax=Erigeron canadensis TaxID=72917 RepID=UPI001CB9D0FD|nr:homeobox-leucine zipper protein HDG11-like [Erigeron canadensis]